MTLTLLLCNLYNAPWPKQFNPEGFCLPIDMEVVQRDTQIKEMWDIDQVAMAAAILEENQDMRNTPFWNVYLFPLEQQALLLRDEFEKERDGRIDGIE